MKSSVLIVDDDKDHAESVADILSAYGYATKVTHSGEEGIGSFRQSDFDIILIDYKMPGMNGVESFLEFRKIRPTAKVILMTGFGLEQLIEQVFGESCLGVLQKPLDEQSLVGLIKQVKPNGTVLILDDDRDLTDGLEAVLVENRYRVMIDTPGIEALNRLFVEDIDCLILDLKMPVLSAIEIFMKLKAAGRFVPTICITGSQDQKEFHLTGLAPTIAQDILMKPFHISSLLSVLKAAAVK